MISNYLSDLAVHQCWRWLRVEIDLAGFRRKIKLTRAIYIFVRFIFQRYFVSRQIGLPLFSTVQPSSSRTISPASQTDRLASRYFILVKKTRSRKEKRRRR